MLVGRRVEHDVRTVLLERGEERLAVGDVDEGLLARAAERGSRIVNMRFIVVEEDQESRIETGNLSADFRTDGATGPRDEHPMPLQRSANALEVGGHWSPPQ